MFKKICLLSSFFVLIFVSCANELIPEQTVETITSGEVANQELLAPTELKISQGNVKSVNLSWKLTKNAVRYKIYSTSVNPPKPSDFELVREINENPFVEISENAGVSKWYYVTAVNIEGKESNPSSYVYGTTLATPLITAIDEDDSGTKATVYWYLDNCFDGNSLYINDVNFSVYVYDSEKKEIRCEELVGKKFIPETKDEIVKYSYTFENLSPKTLYYFEVVAYTSDKVKTEKSGKLDAETARKLMPLSVNNFYAEKGKSTENINVVFNLPEFCDYQESSNEFSRHPLYFKLERKIKTENSEWTILAERISSCENSIPEKKVYKFNCAEDENTKPEDKNYSGDDFEIIVEKSTDTNSETSSNYPGYIADSKLTFIDKTAERGLQYIYRIRSYVDDSKKTITSDATILEDSGWMISYAEFGVGAEYDTTEAILNKVNISIKFDFNDFKSSFEEVNQSVPYTYKLTKIFSRFNDSSDLSLLEKGVSEVLKETSNMEEIKNFSEVLVPSGDLASAESNQGYYAYKIEIIHNGLKENVYEYSSNEQIVVISDITKIPQIENFTVSDGYKDKFILSWKTMKNSEIEISYLDKNSENKEKIIISEEDVLSYEENSETGITTAQIKAVSGDKRLFTLKAKSGLQVEKNFETVSETLGTAIPKIVSYEYDKIIVQWEKVQKAAENYIISAKYTEKSEERGGELAVFDGESKNSEIISSVIEGKTFYTCTILKPYGYNDENISGLPINFSVISTSENVPEETTNGENEVQTVGPALVNTLINDGEDKRIAENDIKVQWKKVKGAAGYIIQRITNDTYSGGSEIKFDTYYFDSSTDYLQLISGETEDIGERTSKISFTEGSEVYFFTDIYKEPEIGKENNNYQVNQSKLSWGIRYDYAIIPVKVGGTKDDFKFNSEEPLKLTDESVINYSKYTEIVDGIETENIKNVKICSGATSGYAQDILAEKAQNGRNQVITFSEPYYKNKNPSIYRRKWISDSNSLSTWEKVNSSTIIPGKYDYSFNPDYSEGFTPYEYIVKYGSAPESITVPVSLVKKLNSLKETRYVYAKPEDVEQKNKGYLQNANFNAMYAGTSDSTENYFTEQLNWSKWDFNSCKLGPEKFEIYIMNSDISAEWIKIAEIASSGEFADTEEVINETNIRKFVNTINLWPEGYEEKTKTNTNGLLKVLRNPKHYYKIVMKGSNTPEIELGGDEDIANKKEIFGYRQITAEEFAIASALSISESLYDDNYSSVEDIGTWSQDKKFVFKSKGPNFHVIDGYIECGGQATGEKPTHYGAGRKNGALSSATSKPATITLTTKNKNGSFDYDGIVVIDTMSSNSGTYTVTYKGVTADYKSLVWNFFPYR